MMTCSICTGHIQVNSDDVIIMEVMMTQWRRTTMKSGPAKDNPLCNYYVIANSWANDMTFENFYSIKHVIYCCNRTYTYSVLEII